MRSITRYDCRRGCEITLYINEHDEVIGMQIFFEEPVDLINFRLEGALNPKMLRTSVGSPYPPPAPPTPPSPTPTRTILRRPTAPCPGCGGNK